MLMWALAGLVVYVSIVAFFVSLCMAAASRDRVMKEYFAAARQNRSSRRRRGGEGTRARNVG